MTEREETNKAAENAEIGAKDETRAQSAPDFIFQRVIAKIIDLIICGALFQLLAVQGGIVGLFYLLFSDGIVGGASVGKRLSGMKTVRPGGQNADFLRSAERNFLLVLAVTPAPFVWMPPFGGVFFALAVVGFGVVLLEFLFALFSPGGRRIGDYIAGTTVVAADSKGSKDERSE